MNNNLKSILPELLQSINGLSTAEALALLAEKFPAQVTFSSSFSYEDQVITHDILENNIDISIFNLDTGRLFTETYSDWNSTNARYGTRVKAYYPNQEHIEQ